MADEPTPQAVIKGAIESALLDVHTAIPARVDKFDDASDTVDATPFIKRRVPSKSEGTVAEKIPTIYDVPVAWPGSSSCFVKWEIPTGSTVLLIFNEACISQWRDTGQVSEPGDLARHDLSYPYAIPIVGPTIAERPGAVGSTWTAEGPELKLGASAEEFVALANLVKQELDTLKAHIAAAAATEAGAGGLGGMTALTNLLGAWPLEVAASKVKAE